MQKIQLLGCLMIVLVCKPADVHADFNACLIRKQVDVDAQIALMAQSEDPEKLVHIARLLIETDTDQAFEAVATKLTDKSFLRLLHLYPADGRKELDYEHVDRGHSLLGAILTGIARHHSEKSSALLLKLLKSDLYIDKVPLFEGAGEGERESAVKDALKQMRHPPKEIILASKWNDPLLWRGRYVIDQVVGQKLIQDYRKLKGRPYDRAKVRKFVMMNRRLHPWGPHVLGEMIVADGEQWEREEALQMLFDSRLKKYDKDFVIHQDYERRAPKWQHGSTKVLKEVLAVAERVEKKAWKPAFRSYIDGAKSQIAKVLQHRKEALEAFRKQLASEKSKALWADEFVSLLVATIKHQRPLIIMDTMAEKASYPATIPTVFAPMPLGGELRRLIENCRHRLPMTPQMAACLKKSLQAKISKAIVR